MVAWPANGATNWNTSMLAYLAVGHNTDGTHKEVINIRDYGAVGDGDGAGGGTDDATAFQNAITAADDGVLSIPEGTYRIDSALTSTSKIHIEGLGKVFLDFSNLTGSTIALKIYGTAGTRLEEKTILENFILHGPDTTARAGAPSTTTKGLHFEYVLGLRLVNVEVEKFHTGVYVTNCWPISDTDCKFHKNYIGLHLDNACTLGTHSSRYLSNYCPLYLHNSVYNQTFLNCDYEGATNNAIVIDPNGSDILALQFINPYFESIGGSAFLIRQQLDETPTTGNVADVLISGGTWSAITDYALNCGTAGVHSFTLLNLYGIDNIAADINGTLKRSFLIGGNFSLAEGFYYFDTDGAAMRFLPKTGAVRLAPHLYVDFGGEVGRILVHEDIKRVTIGASATTTAWSKTLTDDYVYSVEATLLVTKDSTTDCAVYKITGAAYASGGSATLIGTGYTVLSEDENSITGTIVFDTDTADIRLRYTEAGGEALMMSGDIKVLSVKNVAW